MAKLSGNSGRLFINGIDMGEVRSWEAETQPTPLADIENLGQWAETTSTPLEDFDALRRHEEQFGPSPLQAAYGPWKTGEIMKEALLPPPRYPLVCDLSGDPLCCAILRQLARHPWEPTHRCALLDRMEELGYDDQLPLAGFILASQRNLVSYFVHPPQGWSRRARRWLINQVRRQLQRAFGPFEGSTP